MNQMNEKIIAGIIITSLLIIVWLLTLKLKNKQSTINDLNKDLEGHKSSIRDLSFNLTDKQSKIDDLIVKFKKASWILNNQEQKFSNSTLLTEDMSNCIVDKIIAKVGLSNMIVNMSFSDSIKSLISSNSSAASNILPDTTAFLDTMTTLDNTIQICTVGKSCNIPHLYFGTYTTSAGGTQKPTCDYTP